MPGLDRRRLTKLTPLRMHSQERKGVGVFVAACQPWRRSSAKTLLMKHVLVCCHQSVTRASGRAQEVQGVQILLHSGAFGRDAAPQCIASADRYAVRGTGWSTTLQALKGWHAQATPFRCAGAGSTSSSSSCPREAVLSATLPSSSASDLQHQSWTLTVKEECSALSLFLAAGSNTVKEMP